MGLPPFSGNFLRDHQVAAAVHTGTKAIHSDGMEQAGGALLEDGAQRTQCRLPHTSYQSATAYRPSEHRHCRGRRTDP